MEGFTPEQEARIKKMLADQRADMEAKYIEQAHKLRAWINAHPLAASRVALGVGIALGVAGFWLVSRWI